MTLPTGDTPPPYKVYMCLICGWLYNEALGAPEDGIPPGTRLEEVPAGEQELPCLDDDAVLALARYGLQLEEYFH